MGIGTTAPAAKLQIAGQLVTSLPSTLAPNGTTQTIDWSTGNMQIVDLSSTTGNLTLSFTNAVAGGAYAVKIIQAATTRIITWPTSVKWPNGYVYVPSTGNGQVDLVTLFYDGSNFYAAAGKNYQ